MLVTNRFGDNWLSLYEQKRLRHFSKYLLLCSSEEKKPFWFVRTSFYFFGEPTPLTLELLHQEQVNVKFSDLVSFCSVFLLLFNKSSSLGEFADDSD